MFSKYVNIHFYAAANEPRGMPLPRMYEEIRTEKSRCKKDNAPKMPPKRKKKPRFLPYLQQKSRFHKQVMGIEPTSQPWEGRVLPMNYTCSALTL